MARVKRIYDDQSQYYFVTSKTFRNQKVFDDKKNCKLLLVCVKYLVQRKYVELFAWVILPDHFHLLLQIIGAKNISQIMQSIKGNFSWMVQRGTYDINRFAHARKHALQANNNFSVDQAFEPGRGSIKDNRSVEASATERKYVKLWQTSFYDHIIRDQQDFYNHLDYIHYNPVKHRYVSQPEDWPWSSYRDFIKKGYYEKGWGHDIPISIQKIKEL